MGDGAANHRPIFFSTMNKIRDKFPNPVVVRAKIDDEGYPTHTAGEYCILGAAIMHKYNADPLKTAHDVRFPTLGFASKNLGLSLEDAEAVAFLNDMGRFDDAWRKLAEVYVQ